MGWVAIGISIFATNISSEHFIGLAGAGARRGLAVGQFELMAILLLIFLAWIIVPIFIKSGIMTVPEFLELRFDTRLRKIYAGLSIGMYLFTKVLVSLFAAGLLFNSVFGLNIYASAVIIVLVTGLYSVIGGAPAVMKTQVFQGVLLIAAAVVLTLFGLNEAGGYAHLRQSLPGEFFNIFKSASDPDFPWTGIIFGAPIIAFWYWCTDQYIVQRLLSARSINDARRGSILTAFLKILPLFILVLPGLVAASLYPDVSGDEAYMLLLSGSLLPAGIKGFVIAGLLAAVMSSLAGAFNSTAAIFVNDFYKPAHPEASETKLVLIARLATIIIVGGAIFVIPLVRYISSDLYLLLQSVQACFSPPVVAVFVFGFFARKVSTRSAIYTLIVGESFGLLRLLLEIFRNSGVALHPIPAFIVSVNFLHFAIALFAVSMVTFAVFNKNAVPAKVVFGGQVRNILAESVTEIRLNLYNFKASQILGSNVILSAAIFLIVIGLWSLWF